MHKRQLPGKISCGRVLGSARKSNGSSTYCGIFRLWDGKSNPSQLGVGNATVFSGLPPSNQQEDIQA
jgi:hypothetical protein